MNKNNEDIVKRGINYVQEINKWLNQEMENFHTNLDSNFASQNASLQVVDELLKSIIGVIKGETNRNKICNSEATTSAGVNNAYNFKTNLNRLYFSETNLTNNLPQSSSSSEQNQAITSCEKDKILCNNLTTIIKIANNSIELFSNSTQIKEIKSSHGISKIRTSEGPCVNLIDLSTPQQSKAQRKYLAPRKILKAPVTPSNRTRNLNLHDNVRLTSPLYASSPELNLNTKSNMIHNWVSQDSLSTIIKIANDLVNLISKSNQDIFEAPKVKSANSLIDVTTPTQACNKRKILIPNPSRLPEPKKLYRSSTYTTIPKLQPNLSSGKKSSSEANLTITKNKRKS